MPLPRISDETVLTAIDELGGDGFVPVRDLLPALPRRTHADRRRALHRSMDRGLVIQRRAPDGGQFVAIASEGWRRLRDVA